MALSLITDGNFDTAVTAYNAATNLPFGNLTRTGNVAGQDPNSHVKVACTSGVSGVVVNISYEELQDTALADQVVLEEHSQNEVNGKAGYFIRLLLDALDGYYDNDVPATFTPTNAELLAIHRAIGTLVQTAAIPEWRAYTEDRGNAALNTVSVAAVDDDASGAGTAGTITVTLGGTTTHMLVTFVDGVVIDTAINPTHPTYTIAAHEFGGAGTYTVRTIAIGPGGIVEDSVSVTIAIA